MKELDKLQKQLTKDINLVKIEKQIINPFDRSENPHEESKDEEEQSESD